MIFEKFQRGRNPQCSTPSKQSFWLSIPPMIHQTSFNGFKAVVVIARWTISAAIGVVAFVAVVVALKSNRKSIDS